MKSERSLHLAIAALSLGLIGAVANLAAPAHALSLFGDDDDAWFDNNGHGGGERRHQRHYEGTSDSRLTGRTPLLAVVALREQRITVYDAGGKMMKSPVSSGTSGLETPSGIFSVVQKDEDHHSSLFDDASMPFMERITWTGISLHAGVLPGYAASHGCVRMPEQFAYQLYQVSKLGLRVILVRDDIAPVEVAQPPMFMAAGTPPSGDPSSRLKTLASQKSVEADAATRQYKDAKLAAAKKAGEAATAEKAVRAAEAVLASAEAELKAAARAVETASSPERTQQAEAAKAQTASRVEAAQVKLDAAKLDAQAKSEASSKAEQDLRTASAATAKARDAAEEAQLDLSPVSVSSAARRSAYTSARTTCRSSKPRSSSAMRTSPSARSSSPPWTTALPRAPCAGTSFPCTRMWPIWSPPSPRPRARPKSPKPKPPPLTFPERTRHLAGLP